ncbi:MAG TPA: aminomethyl-transferring glycine dehydrogenase [Burkholderiales bacterium]|nr:aminomethyl-transferring glycine dehydrogenase [Burkholderiales bacterium]
MHSIEFDSFARRHIGPDEREEQAMLGAIGVSSLEELVRKAVPSSIALETPLDLQPPLTEPQALAELKRIATRNKIFKSYIGMGYYGTHTPGVIQRNVLENPAWYTAYTPYQSEISQGRLEALLNFQTMVCELTAMDVANASLLDEATAAAEAMAMCRRNSKSRTERFVVSAGCLPQTIAVVRTRAECIGFEVVVARDTELLDHDAFGYLLQYPAADGAINDYRDFVVKAHERGALVAVAADLLALALIAPPGEWGADICVGTTQRFGVPMGFGGPHAAYLGCKDAFKRTMPGRLVGVSVDARGKPALRLALATREQHIRREKATSNICTAQVLLAVMASMYALYHGPEGVRAIAMRVARYTAELARALSSAGLRVVNAHAFDTLTIDTAHHTAEIVGRALARRINLRRIDARTLGVALDETTSAADMQALVQIFTAAASGSFDTERGDSRHARSGLAAGTLLPAQLVRTAPCLRHPVFSRYRSETEMLRYLRALADKDLALDRTMIPLGSCTMKLNATTEMMPISWPELANIHPFAPAYQVQGYLELIGSLERMLEACTGYDAVSLQPNSGAQGEYAGLLAIRAYHRSRGDHARIAVLIPSSAHGTNPASAALAGMQVVLVGCDAEGNVDIRDLEEKAKRHSATLAALMVTYPSTHGVFEPGIVEICEIVHRHGGQVYLDGANLNAMVGVAAPGKFGADVSHLNLHKTFCIPHGGGGPGVGPIAVRAHLAPFLPGHPLKTATPGAVGPVAAAPYGSAGILAISWAYVAMMGAPGLLRATQVAILNANYIAARLATHYPVLYRGSNGLVAHECILDLREIRTRSGISNEDIAKRLVDYGFHAPTMSFPVPGTLMVEPTESESKRELDRFIDAMIAIGKEISAVESGVFDKTDNPLTNAPHTAEMVAADTWTHPYSRSVAAYPLPNLREHKYWPPVARVDNIYGDRNLMCSCPPVSTYETGAGADTEDAVGAEVAARA